MTHCCSRLYVPGVVLSYTRNQRTLHPNHSLIRIDGVKSKEDTQFYLGKRVAYVYSGKKDTKKKPRKRIIWGRITRHHGDNGVVQAKFRHNLPAESFGRQCRIMLYPSNI